MGFPSDLAAFALSKYKLDLEQAMDYLFSKDMSLIQVEMAQQSSSNPSQGSEEFSSL